MCWENQKVAVLICPKVQYFIEPSLRIMSKPLFFKVSPCDFFFLEPVNQDLVLRSSLRISLLEDLGGLAEKLGGQQGDHRQGETVALAGAANRRSSP